MPNFNTTVDDGPDTRDPRTLNWAERIRDAVIPFALDADGYPVNPIEPHLPFGQGGLWHHGEAVAADAIVIIVDSAGRRWLLLIDRGDNHGWGLPGGGLNPGELPEVAVGRELAEETGLELKFTAHDLLEGQYVPDPRAARGAWMVTFPGVKVLHTDTLPAVAGRDDARRAEWLPAGNYLELEAAVAALDGRVFPAHTNLLRAQLG